MSCHKTIIIQMDNLNGHFRYLNWRHVAIDIHIYMYTCIHIYMYIYIKGLWKPYPKNISPKYGFMWFGYLYFLQKKTVGNPNVPPVLDQGFNSEDTMTTGVFRWRASVARKNGKVWTMATLKMVGSTKDL